VITVLLIRHAAIDTGGRLCGCLDVPLTAAGRAHVEAVVGSGPARPAPDVLFTSPLARAREVAARLGAAWGLDPETAGWAREIDCGRFEGMPLDRLQREFPALWASNQAQTDDQFAWPGGETYHEVRARVLAGVQSIAKDYDGGRVAVVTHAGVISAIMGTIRGRAAAAWSADRPDPFTATEIVWDDDAPRAVLTFNERDWF
jgi:broad specificity phosphatase PhoE